MKRHVLRFVVAGLLMCLLTGFAFAAPVPTALKAKLVATFPSGYRQGVNRLVFSPDGKMLASAGLFDKTIKLWDIASRKNTATLEGVGDFSVFALLSFSPDSKTLVTAAYRQETSINVWDVASGKEIAAIKGCRGTTALQFSKDGRTLAAGILHEVHLWDVPSYKERATIKLKLERGYVLKSLALTRDGRFLALAGGNESLIVHEVTTTNDKKRGLTLESSSSSVSSSFFSPDGKNVASISSLYSVRLWAVDSGKNIANYKQSYKIGFLAYSPNGKILALSSWTKNNSIHLLNARTGTELGTLTEDKADPSPMAFSPDGTFLAAADQDNIYLWDVRAIGDPGK